ncbi:prepilin-type N-terminal cleavage/methylation domain-containing protein [Yersinia sp. 1652 StPb PI]|uniref:prepilin-type N-terminal cleavage/methylation domain-containing protein n=1 Tax=unclassified Yersinia (in: enterobacteria) TaxID=2653513 RepID=UPI00355AD233
MKRSDQYHPRNQRGFSLPEALIAALFFSVSLLGLLQYHQALLQGFSSVWQQRQAWFLLHQHIDSAGEDRPDRGFISGMKPNWLYRQSISRIEGECTELNFTLAVRKNLSAELTRWFCSTNGSG